MKHVERCDATTYCGRPILRPALAGQGYDVRPNTIPRTDVITSADSSTEGVCKRCLRALLDALPEKS